MVDKRNGVVVRVLLRKEQYEKIKDICENDYNTTIEAMLQATVDYHIEHRKNYDNGRDQKPL